MGDEVRKNHHAGQISRIETAVQLTRTTMMKMIVDSDVDGRGRARDKLQSVRDVDFVPCKQRR